MGESRERERDIRKVVPQTLAEGVVKKKSSLMPAITH